MAKAVWALDLGEWSLKIVRAREINRGTGQITVDLVEVIKYSDLPCGYEAHVTERYHEGIRAFLERHPIGKGDRVCVGVTGHEVFSRFIDLPPVPLKRVPEIVRYEARQQIPFNIDEVVWDYQPVKEEFEPGEEIRIGLFALKRERVTEFLEMFQPFRSNLHCIQAAPLALYNFILFDGATTGPTIVLDLGAHTTDLLVVDYPNFWIRPILVAGDNLTMAIQQQFNVSKEEAETIKERVGSSKHARQVFDVIRPIVRNTVSEVQRSLGYYKSVAEEVKFEKVLVVGGSMKLLGMDKLIAENLQYDISPLEGVNRFMPGPGVDPALWQENLSSLAVALGLLVQGFDSAPMKVNLIPEEVVRQVALNRKRPFVLAGVCGMILIVLLLWMSNKLLARELLKGEKTGVQTLLKIQRLDSQWGQAKSEVEGARRPIEPLLVEGTNRSAWVKLLPAVGGAIPEGQMFVKAIRVDWRSQKELDGEVDKGGAATGPVRPWWEQMGEMELPPGEEEMMMPEEEMMGPGEDPTAKVKTGQKGLDSRLTIYIDGESLKPEVAFIDRQFIEKLKAYQWEGAPVPVFKEVERLGVPRIVYRHPLTGDVVRAEIAKQPAELTMPDGSVIKLEYERYLDFRARAVLKTPEEMRQEVEKAEAENKKQPGAPADAAAPGPETPKSP
jgi:type IV pilus assembly protein PilM